MSIDYTKANLITSLKTDMIYEVLTGSLYVSGVSGYSTSVTEYSSSPYIACYEAFYSTDGGINYTPCSMINGSAALENTGCGVVEKVDPFGNISLDIYGFVFDMFSSTNVHSATINYKIILYNSHKNIQRWGIYGGYVNTNSTIVQNVFLDSKYKAKTIYKDDVIPFVIDPVNAYTITIPHTLGYIPRVMAWYISSAGTYIYQFIYNAPDQYIDIFPTTNNVTFSFRANSGLTADSGNLYYRIYNK